MEPQDTVGLVHSEQGDIRESFVGLVNLLYDERLVFESDDALTFEHKQDGYGTPRPMTPSDVRVAQTTKERRLASICRAKSGNYWRLNINFSHWQTLHDYHRLGVLIHEATHLAASSHDERFWTLHARLIERATRREQAVTALLDIQPHSGALTDFLLRCMERQYDGIQDCGEVMTDLTAELNCSPDYDLFFDRDAKHVPYIRFAGTECEQVPLACIKMPEIGYTDAELYAFARENLELDDDENQVIALTHPIRGIAVPTDSGELQAVELLSNNRAVALADRFGYETVPCEIVNQDALQQD